MANSQIITQLRKKSASGGYDTFYLGPEQRYSGALPTSNNNNLEEQLLMGLDRVIKTWHDNETNTDRQTIMFCRESDTSNYYILEIYKYKSGSDNDSVYVKVNAIYFTEGMSEDDGILVEDSYNEKIEYDANTETLFLVPNMVAEKDILNYVQEDGNILKVSSKSITQSFEDNVIITKEVITNYL